MITLQVENQYTTIKGTFKPKILRRLKTVSSYYVKGAHFSHNFQNRYWDGREHLLTFSKKRGYRFPTGLLKSIMKELDALKIKYKIDTSKRYRPKTRRRVFYAWNEKEFPMDRDYQNKAIQSTMEHELFEASGILVLPMRSGKTVIVGRMICDMAVKALVIVDSKYLLYQTQKLLSKALYVDVGLVGDGHWNVRDVTVATAQTLNIARGGKRKEGRKTIKLPTDPRYEELLKKFDMVFFDEVHHLVAETFHLVMMDFDVPFKIGISATVEDQNQNEIEKGVIWLKACCGEVRTRVSASELIRQGYLLQQNIFLYRVDKPDLNDRGWSQRLAKKAIYKNKYRNKLIIKIAKRELKLGYSVLIIANRLEQIKILARKFEKADIAFWTVTGNDSQEARDSKVGDFVDGGVKVLIGTVLGEGVNIPEIESVINAEGGQDPKRAMQRMRNLTPAEGKTTARYHDFLDFTNRYFAGHSRARLEKYRSEAEFKIKICRDFE